MKASERGRRRSGEEGVVRIREQKNSAWALDPRKGLQPPHLGQKVFPTIHGKHDDGVQMLRGTPQHQASLPQAGGKSDDQKPAVTAAAAAAAAAAFMLFTSAPMLIITASHPPQGKQLYAGRTSRIGHNCGRTVVVLTMRLSLDEQKSKVCLGG